MAKKFVQVAGLNKVFSAITASGATTWSYTGTEADENSILYITATAADSKFNTPYNVEGAHWIWARGQLYDGNTPELQRLTSVQGQTGDITINDSLEIIIRKLIKKVGDAADAGVQTLTTVDDAWVTVNPDLDASSGTVTLTLAHGDAGTAATTKEGAATAAADWGETAKVTIPTVGIDAKGHVSVLNTSEFSVVTLPAKPVTSLTTSGDSEVTVTKNTEATGDVTVEVKHAAHDAVKAGETGDKKLTADASSFKVLEVSTNGTGHVISAAERTITLPENAFKNDDTTYTFADGTQQFTVTPKGGTAQTVNVAHMAKGAGTASATDGTYVSAVAVDEYGHVTATASNTNGVYSSDKENHAEGEIAIWNGVTNEMATSNMTIRDGEITEDSSASTLPTTKQVIDYVIKNKVAGAMTYKGLIASYAALSKITGMNAGDVYVLSADDTSDGYEKGDMFIYNGTSKKWDYVPAGDTTVTNKDAEIGTSLTEIAVIDGVSIKAKVAKETELNVTKNDKVTSGLTYVSSVVKGTGSHDLTVTTSTIQDGTTEQKGVLKLLDSSVSDSTSEAATPNAVKEVNELAKSKSTVSYSQIVKSTDTSAYEIGKITIDGTETVIYGHDKDTVYVHPAAPTDGSAAKATPGTAKATTVLTGATIDASGHVAGLTTSDISDAYKQREVKVNGVSKIASTVTTALDLSAGSNITLDYDTTNNKVVIKAADNTDEKVKVEKISDQEQTTFYVVSQHPDKVENGANTAYYDTQVYIQKGALHATSLYEVNKSIHESFSDEWGTIA